MCKTKCLEMCSFSITLTPLYSLNLHFYYFPISFLLLYLSSQLDSLHRHPDFPHFSHFHLDFRPRFQENSCFRSKTNTAFC